MPFGVGDDSNFTFNTLMMTPLFLSLDEDSMATLCECFKIREIKDGTLMCNIDDVTDQIFVVAKGFNFFSSFICAFDSCLKLSVVVPFGRWWEKRELPNHVPC